MTTDEPRGLDAPVWFSDGKVNETLFCEQFIKDHPLKYIKRSFYSVDGRIDDEEQIKNLIYDEVKYYQSYGVAKKVTALLDLLRLECFSPQIPPDCDKIHTLNGTLFLSGKFTKEKEFCANRLPVAYNPDAPAPEKWLDFLNQLLYPEDIPTLQEYMGYCLIPSTKGQKMLFLVGKGGEGKSRIGVVMNKLFAANMNTGSAALHQLHQIHRDSRTAHGSGGEVQAELSGADLCPLPGIRQRHTPIPLRQE